MTCYNKTTKYSTDHCASGKLYWSRNGYICIYLYTCISHIIVNLKNEKNGTKPNASTLPS